MRRPASDANPISAQGSGCGASSLRRGVLFVAYPLLPVSEESAGGAEQILCLLERELARQGWQTEVAACAGSQVAGRLLVTGDAPRALDGFAEREREHTERVVAACATGAYEMVLDHSGHFFGHASRVHAPVLATLHLPRQLYAADAFDNLAGNVFFHCVSESQRQDFLDLPRMLGVVRNGINLNRFARPQGSPPSPPTLRLGRDGRERGEWSHCDGEDRSDFLLWLGRVCPEKAPHLAIEAAERAGMPIVLAGQVYPFAWHRQYWEREVAPRIDGRRVRWIELPTSVEKCHLLREARALLVTSQIAETTSLVALEAMASGTSVIAFRRGALAEVVVEGTGFLVESVEQMAAACGRMREIRAEDCRAWVQREYSVAAMVAGYEGVIQMALAGMPLSSR